MAGKVAKAYPLPFQSDLTHARRQGDLIVADVVDLELSGAGVAHQHVAGLAGVAGEIGETRDHPGRADLADRIWAADVVVTDVVYFQLPVAGVAHQHVGRVGPREAAEACDLP